MPNVPHLKLPELLDTYPVASINMNDNSRQLIQTVLDIGKRPLTDLDIQKALSHPTWGRCIYLDILFNVVLQMTWIDRKVKAILDHFKVLGLKIEHKIAVRYAKEHARTSKHSVKLDQKDDLDNIVIREVKEQISFVTKMIAYFTAIIATLYTTILSLQRRFAHIKHAHADLSHGVINLHKAQQLNFMRLIHRLGMENAQQITIPEKSYHHLLEFHHQPPKLQDEFIHSLKLYPKNQHLTTEDIRNLLHHPEVMKTLQKFQKQRMGFEVSLSQKIEELTGNRMATHGHKQELQEHLVRVNDLNKQLTLKNSELGVLLSPMLRAQMAEQDLVHDTAKSIAPAAGRLIEAKA